MARRNKRQKKTEKIVVPKELIMEAKKPRYNPFQSGTGAHKTIKSYTRKEKHKQKLF